MRILIDFALVSFRAIIGGTMALCAISGRNRDDDEK